MQEEAEAEEDDYMSAAFLQGGDGRGGVDPRSELPAWKRKAAVRERQARLIEEARAQPKPREMEKLERERGLSQPIPEENKGFGMLLKMGFKPGQGLGKDAAGISEPLAIEIKTKTRAGLGMDDILKRAEEAKVRTRELHVQAKQSLAEADGAKREELFKLRMQDKFALRGTLNDLRKAQNTCRQMDMENLVTESELWMQQEATDEPDSKKARSNEVEDGFATLQPKDRLLVVTEYLRSTYFYCIWCGCSYNGSEDLAASCPGNAADLHDD